MCIVIWNRFEENLSKRAATNISTIMMFRILNIDPAMVHFAMMFQTISSHYATSILLFICNIYLYETGCLAREYNYLLHNIQHTIHIEISSN